MIARKFVSFFLVCGLLLSFFLVSVVNLVDVREVKADSNISNFGVIRKTGSYSISQGQTSDWYYLKIDQQITDYDSSVSHQIEYVGFSKNTRGDIGFTKDGSYVGRLVPVVAGKFGGNWWLVPIRNVDMVSQLGTVDGSDEQGSYTKIYYSGSGTFTAYKYDDYATTNTVDLTINEISIKCYHSNAECKVYTDVSLGVTPQDSGFGFLFVPDDPQMFRYVSYNDSQYDLLSAQKLSNPDLMLEFWSQAGQRLGVKWKWRDLYELGSGTHFEILSIQGLYGLLTGSYGYGVLNRIVVDPTLTVSESGSELSVVNTWNGGSSGYNFTILQSAMVIDRLYDYEVADWVWDGDQSDAASQGLQQLALIDFTGDSWSSSRDAASTFMVLEESDSRIKLKISGSDNQFDIEWVITVYTTSRIFYMDCTWTHTNATEHNMYMFYPASICDKVQDDSHTPTFQEDNTDDVYSTNATYGGYGIITLEYNEEAADGWDNASPYNDQLEIYDGTNRTLSQDETVEFTLGIYIHSQTTDPTALVDELDDEICDAFPAISGESGLTYDGRNNSTGAFDFTHSSGNDGSFTFTDIDTEQNYTAFHIVDWGTSDYALYIDSVEKTEDTDYYAYYNSTSGDLDIVYPELSTCTVSLDVGMPAFADWGNYLKLTIDSDDVDEELTNFTVLIHLSGSCGINSYDATAVFDEVGSDYNATAFYLSDNSTALYWENEYWNDTSEEGDFWVRVPTISNTSDMVVWLGYNSSLSGTAYNSPTDVWDSDFVMVQHMNDNSTSTVLDSTSNDNDGTKTGANEPIEVTGVIGKSQSFDGENDDISIANEPNFDITDYITIEAWISKTDWTIGNNYKIIFSKHHYSYEFRVHIKKYIGFQANRGSNIIAYCSSELSPNEHYVAFRFDKDTQNINGEYHSLFLDGLLVTNTWVEGSDTNTQLVLTDYNPYIGSRTGVSLFSDCIEDEIRVSEVARSDAWVGASYETQRDHLIVFGSASPVNSDAQVTNLDDTDNIYAQLREYTLTYNGTHSDGYASFATVDLTIQTGGATERLTIRYNESADTFTEQSGDTTKWTLITGSSSSTKSGTSLDLTVALKAEWDATEEADLDIKAVATDDKDSTDTDTYDVNYDVVTNLVVSGFACDDDRGNVEQTITFTGTVYYANNPSSSTATTFYPADVEFTSVSVYDDWNNNEGTDSTIVNGAFTVAFTANATAGLETYNPYINMADTDYTDAEESVTDTYIADGLSIASIGSPSFLDNGDFSYEIQLQYAYNSSGINGGIVRIVHSNGTELTTGFTCNSTGYATIVLGQTNSSASGTYYVIGHTEPDHSITDMYANQTFVVNSWALQGRDASGTNLPRSVDYDVDVSSSNFNEWTSDTSGLSTTIYAPNATTYTITATWGTHTVYSDSVALSSNGTSNLDTKIQRLDDVTYYVLISLNNTDLTAPSLQGESDIYISGVSATGSKEIKYDHANWDRTDEPVSWESGTSSYAKGDGTWSWASSIFTFTHTFTGTQDITLSWSVGGGEGGGGGSGGGTTPDIGPEEGGEIGVPVEGGEVPEEPTAPTEPLITPPKELDLTPELAVFGVAAIVIGVAVLAERKQHKETPKKFKNKKYKNKKFKKKTGF